MLTKSGKSEKDAKEILEVIAHFACWTKNSEHIVDSSIILLIL